MPKGVTEEDLTMYSIVSHRKDCVSYLEQDWLPAEGLSDMIWLLF